jgi:hypothetical protein
MLDPEVVVNLLPKLGVGVDFVRHGQRFFELVHSSTVTDPLNTPKAHRNLREIVQVLRTVIRVYDGAGNMIERQEQAAGSEGAVNFGLASCHTTR